MHYVQKHRRSWLWVCFALLGIAGAAQSQIELSGLIVEDISADSPANKAGLKKGDLLLTYDGKPLLSPASLQASSENTFGKNEIVLQIRREATAVTLSVPPGLLGVQARPELPSVMLALYEEGKAANVRNAGENVAKWMAAAKAAQDAGQRDTAAWLLDGVGKIHETQQRWKEAIAEYMAAWGLLENSRDAAAQSRTLVALGRCSRNLNDLSDAQRWFEQAEAVDTAAGNKIWVAGDLNNLGLVAYGRGDLDATQEFFTRATAILEQSNPNSLTLAGSISNLGVIAWRRGDVQTAENNYRRALAIDEKLAPSSLEVAKDLNNLGLTAWSRGDLDPAHDYFTRSLAIKERIAADSLDVANTLNNLGNVAYDHDDLEAAQDYQSRALAIRERLAPDSLDVAMSLNNLSNVAYARGNLPLAQDRQTRALTIRERLAPGSLEVAYSLATLGNVARDRGEFAAAHDYYGRSLAIRERLTPKSLEVAKSLTDSGTLALKEREYSNARTLFTRAVDIVESQRSRIAVTEARAMLMAAHTNSYWGLLRAQVLLGDVPAAFATVERARARSLLDLLAEANVDVQQDIAPALKRREQDTHARIASIQRQFIQIRSQQPPNENKMAQLEEQLNQVEREREQLESEIRRNHPRYAELQYPTPLGLHAIQELLDERTALLEYALGEDGSFLFIVTRADCFVIELPSTSSLSDRLKRLRDTLISKPQRRELVGYIEEARSLYQVLIEPAQKLLKDKKQLIIVPDGILHYLPFEVLLSSGDPRTLTALPPRRWPYLVREYALSYVQSSTVLASLQHSRHARRPQAKDFLAFADPDFAAVNPDSKPASAMRSAFGSLKSWKLDRLPYSGEEAGRIAALFPQEKTRVFLQQAASEENVKANAAFGEYRFVHFAVHGLLNETKPEFSGLVLSLPAAPSQEDGLLQVYEIFNLKLSADLVVLSACETGLGKAVKGEGLLGLTRAFLHAGTPSVIVSLWNVSDRSTAELMVSFYKQLKKGALSKAEALQLAQLELINGGRYAEPFYWAPFILVGDMK